MIKWKITSVDESLSGCYEYQAHIGLDTLVAKLTITTSSRGRDINPRIIFRVKVYDMDMLRQALTDAFLQAIPVRKRELKITQYLECEYGKYEGGRSDPNFDFDYWLDTFNQNIKDLFIDITHNALPFQQSILEDIKRVVGYKNKRGYTEEIIRLMDNNQHDDALNLPRQACQLRDGAYIKSDYNPGFLKEVVARCKEKQLNDLALEFCKLAPTAQQSRWEFAQYHWRIYKSLYGSTNVELLCQHLQSMAECYQNIITEEHYKEGSRYYNAARLKLAEALDEVFHLCNLKIIDLSENKKLEYKELRLRVLLEVRKISRSDEELLVDSDKLDAQTKIDRAFAQLRGESGLDPAIKNIQGEPDMLIALAREVYALKKENAELKRDSKSQRKLKRPREEDPADLATEAEDKRQRYLDSFFYPIKKERTEKTESVDQEVLPTPSISAQTHLTGSDKRPYLPHF